MAIKPQIVVQDHQGIHNANFEGTTKRIKESRSYEDLSTICIVPCMDYVPSKVVQNWMGLMSAMNQKFIRIFVMNMEVGSAYSETIDNVILSNPELANWKYILTLEHDNMPPPDGLLKLYESIKNYDAVGGIYFTKGPMGQPMCYGKPDVYPSNFIPFIPEPDSVTRCNGLGMGFTLFRMEMFKDRRLPRPLFETVQEYIPGQGARAYTQDLKFFEEAGKLGYKFACDSRVRVGHYDVKEDIIW
jgi:hypothetical protein